MDDYELKNIIIRQTAALESAVKVMVIDRDVIYESHKDVNGQILNAIARIDYQNVNKAIEQCQSAIVSGRAVQEEHNVSPT